MFLDSALYHIAHDLAGTHPHKVLHVIQAEILLSYYYLNAGSVLEGTYHASAALSLTFSSGLHLIRSSAAPNDTFLDPLSGLKYRLDPPSDFTEEGERVNAFWAVVVLNNYWIALYGPHAQAALGVPHGAIDTPWPLEFEEYQSVGPSGICIIRTVSNDNPFRVNCHRKVREPRKVFCVV